MLGFRFIFGIVLSTYGEILNVHQSKVVNLWNTNVLIVNERAHANNFSFDLGNHTSLIYFDIYFIFFIRVCLLFHITCSDETENIASSTDDGKISRHEASSTNRRTGQLLR